MNAKELLRKQNGNRMDIIVRYIALEGDDRLYGKMNRIRRKERGNSPPRKQANGRYINELCREIKKDGIRKPVPVNPDYSLINGSHRVAIALYLDIDVPVVILSHKKVPPYGMEWFERHEFPAGDIERIRQKYDEVLGEHSTSFELHGEYWRQPEQCWHV